MRASRPVALALMALLALACGCDLEERRQCDQLGSDSAALLTKTQALLTEIAQSKAGLFSALDPAVQLRSKELDALGDSIADRWEKASPQCKARVESRTKSVRESNALLADWSPDRLVESRDREREEQARLEAERLAEERRLAEEEAARERLGKALGVRLDAIQPRRRSPYSISLEFVLPVTFENRSDEPIVAASGRLKCYSTLDNLEGHFYTEQTELVLAPGAARTIELVTDDIRSRWLQTATCARQVWEPEAIRFETSGVVRAPLPDAPLVF